MASTSALSPFSSPLGPLHYAPPSTFSLFSRSSKSSSPSSSSKRTKTSSSASKTALKISYPTLVSTSNRDLLDGSSIAVGVPTYSPSRPDSSAFPRAPSPPPPYRQSFLDFDEDEDVQDAEELDVARVEEKALVQVEVVEARMRSWDSERVQREAEELRKTDAAVAEELRRLGL
ncbi:hypothetical protein JCM8097_000158 [Rhodosporidiobolus ruineniae]